MTNEISKELIDNIDQRSKELVKHTGDMRTNISLIANLFGDPKYCAICHSNVEYIGHDKTTDCFDHEAKPKINIDIDHFQSGNFFHTGGHSYTFEWFDNGIRCLEYEACAVMQEHVDDDEAGEYEAFDIEDLDRKVIAYIVKHNNLIDFIVELSEQLNTKSKFYEKMSKIAEKLAEAVK